jgi:hypothetical protein
MGPHTSPLLLQSDVLDCVPVRSDECRTHVRPETKFLRLKVPVRVGFRFGEWRVCWLGGWTRQHTNHFLFRLSLVPRRWTHGNELESGALRPRSVVVNLIGYIVDNAARPDGNGVVFIEFRPRAD